MKPLALLSLLLFFGTGQLAPLNAAPLKTVSREMKEAVVIAKKIIEAVSDDAEYARANTQLDFFTLENAFAETTAYDCFYGGWPSQRVARDGKTFCQNPNRFPYYQKSNLKNNCNSNTEMSCNPLIFGPNICIDTSAPELRKSTFFRCEKLFQAQYHGNYDFLTPDQAPTLEKLMELVQNICVSGTSHQKGTGMCTLFLKKMEQIKKLKLAKGEATEKEKPVVEPKKPAVEKPTFKKTAIEKPVTPKKSVDLTKNENCPDCHGGKVTNPAPSAIKEAAKALEGDTAAAVYKKIKDQYLSSGQCHRYYYLPKEDQHAYKIKLYQAEIGAFRPTDGNAMSEGKAFDVLKEDVSFTADESEKLMVLRANLPKKGEALYQEKRAVFQAQLISSFQAHLDESEKLMVLRANLPKKGEALYQEKRAVFQAQLISSFQAHLGYDSLQKNISKRSEELFDKLGIPKDCDPNDNDFISFEAFKEAFDAKKLVSKRLKKQNIMTILDRSLNKRSRRLMTIDLSTNKVLAHTIAGFGDGAPGEQTQDNEAESCSNTNESHLSPHGYGVTGITRKSSQGTFGGLGTFVTTGNDSKGDLKDRGIAFHQMVTGSGDVFSGYAKDDDSVSPGDLLKNTHSGKPEDVNYFLYKSIAQTPNGGATKACIAIPDDRLDKVQKTIQGGSYVYFYCPKEMRK